MSAAVAFAPSIVNRGVHLHPLSLNNAPTKALVGASLKGYSLHCIIFRTATDSAMGSGHFLVNAAYQVANFVVDLLETNCWDNDEINADVVYWKRRVVENCIYGIDINKLSVLLARLSLWLISASNDKALSFIDHHLKCGNSIVGTSLNRVQYYNKDIPILSVYKEQYMYPIIKKYEEIKCIGSDTKDDVAQQHRIYDEIVSDLRLVRRKFDYYLASLYAGGVEDELELFNALTAYDESYFNNVKFDALFEYADSQRFFHWELEFPEVYMNGGFDAAIGNPPYVECTTDLFEHVGLETLGSRNLYSYMMENTINHVRSDGKYGFIVPLAAMYSSKMDSLQRMLKSKGILRVSNYGIRPAKIFKRAEQRVSIIIGALGGESKIYSTNYQRWFTDERIHLFKNIKYLDVTELGKFKFVPKISHEIEKSILLKICKCDKKIGDYTISAGSNEIIYHSVGRYWLKAFDFVPVFKNEKSGVSRSSKYKSLYFKEEVSRSVILALINSSLFYWYWIVMSAARDFTKKDIGEFPYDNSLSAAVDYKKLDNLVFELMGSYQEHSIMLETNGVNGKTILQEFHPSHNKNIMDQIELIIGEMYGLSDEEIQYLINYDLRFRMGDDED